MDKARRSLPGRLHRRDDGAVDQSRRFA